MVFLSMWISDTDKIAPIRYLLGVASAFGVGLIWAGGWALANRLFDGHARIGRHLFITGCGLTALQSWGAVSAALAYAFSLEFLTAYTNQVALVISIGMIMFHLITIKPRHPQRFVVLGVVLGLFGTGFTLMNNYQRIGQASDELYMSQLLPPILRVSPNHSVAQFINDANKLKAKVDDASSKPVGASDNSDQD